MVAGAEETSRVSGDVATVAKFVVAGEARSVDWPEIGPTVRTLDGAEAGGAFVAGAGGGGTAATAFVGAASASETCATVFSGGKFFVSSSADCGLT